MNYGIERSDSMKFLDLRILMFYKIVYHLNNQIIFSKIYIKIFLLKRKLSLLNYREFEFNLEFKTILYFYNDIIQKSFEKILKFDRKLNLHKIVTVFTISKY